MEQPRQVPMALGGFEVDPSAWRLRPPGRDAWTRVRRPRGRMQRAVLPRRTSIEARGKLEAVALRSGGHGIADTADASSAPV